MRQPPQNLEFEQSVLGSMILHDESRLTYLSKLHRSDFYKTAHQNIYQAISRMVLKGLPVDLTTLHTHLKESGRLDCSGGVTYLASLINDVPLPSSDDYYAEVLMQKSAMRRLIIAASQIAEAAYQSNGDAPDVLNDAYGKILGIEIKKDAGELTHVSELAADAIGKLEMIQERIRTGKLTGIPYGLADLDRLTGGLQTGEVTILAGRPGMGKTALALNILRNAAERGHRSAIFSLEMEKISMILRVLGLESKLGSGKFRNCRMDQQEWGAVTEAAKRMSELPIWIDDTPKMHYSELIKKMTQAVQKNKIELFAIDYLGFLVGDNQSNRVQEVKEISRAIKSTAKKLGVSVILLSQLNRMVEQRPDKHPRMSDLRDSGDIEQDADNILMLYRDSVYNKDPGNPNRFFADLDLVKQRNGPTGRVTAFFHEETMIFRNAERSRSGACEAPAF